MSLSKEKSKVDEVTENQPENRLRLQLLREKIEEVLLRRFHEKFPEDQAKLYDELIKTANKNKMNSLLEKKKIHQDDYNKVIPPYGCFVDSKNFDVPLLLVLLINLCDKSKDHEATYNELKKNRNLIQHGSSTEEFEKIFKPVKKSLMAIGATDAEVDKIKTIKIVDEQTKEDIKKMEKTVEVFNYNCSPPMKNFFGREKEIKNLHQLLIESFNDDMLGVAVTGCGGNGKSETARQYWKIHGKIYYDSVIWIDCQNTTLIENSFRTVSERCGMQKSKLNEVVESVYKHFLKRKDPKKQRKVLFIFDNVQDQEMLKDFLPKQSAPHILITSQCQQWDDRCFNVLPLDVFSEEDALKFLENSIKEYQRTDPNDNLKLVRELGFHPVKMHKAFSYIIDNKMSVKRYLPLYETRETELMSEPTAPLGGF